MVVSGAVAAAGLGAAVGAMGAMFGSPVIDVLVIAGGLAIVGFLLLSDRPWQLDRETPGSWLEYHDWRTVAYNGLALGVGMVSRIGYWGWYVLPLGALALRDPIVGAVVFVVYACTRLVLSTTVSSRVRPGYLTSRQRLFANVLDPITALSVGFFLGMVWLNLTS